MIEYCHLPNLGDGKTGLDDFLASHTVDELWTLVRPDPPKLEEPAPLTPLESDASVTSEGSRFKEPGNGAELLNDIEKFTTRFVAYPSEAARIAHTLWIAHTWFMYCWESTPRIAFLSPEPSSGKSRALEVTEPLVPRPIMTVNNSPAYLFRKVSDEAGLPTILYDEIDTVFGPKAKDNEDIRGMLNAGHRRGAVAGRCITRGNNIVTEELPAYCAVALAGLNDLPDTIRTRSVIIRMRRRAPGEHVEPWRHRVNAPQAQLIAQDLARWAETSIHRLAWPDMPAGIEDRNADVWEALLAVADLAGGDWPDQARRAAVTLVTAAAEQGQSLGIQLLTDLRTVFGDHPALFTETILELLHALEESPWNNLRGNPLDSRGLSSRLRKYEVPSPTTVRIGDKIQKGYKREWLVDLWARYLPPSPDSAVTSDTSDTSPSEDVKDVTDVTDKSQDGATTNGHHIPTCAGRWETCANTNCLTFNACVLADMEMSS
jgi:hypothetical protein